MDISSCNRTSPSYKQCNGNNEQLDEYEDPSEDKMPIVNLFSEDD